MTAYRFVGSPGFRNWTCILGALPLGAASDGVTYSLPFSCEYAIKPAIPINTNTRPNRYILVIVLPAHLRQSPKMAFPLSLANKRLFNSVNPQLNSLHASPRTDSQVINFSKLGLLFRRRNAYSTLISATRLPNRQSSQMM